MKGWVCHQSCIFERIVCIILYKNVSIPTFHNYIMDSIQTKNSYKLIDMNEK